MIHFGICGNYALNDECFEDCLSCNCFIRTDEDYEVMFFNGVEVNEK